MSETEDVTFIDPCLAPFKFNPTAQTNPDSDKFTGNNIAFNLNEFEIEPSICEVTYTCTSIAKLTGDMKTIDCSDARVTHGLVNVNGNL